MGLQRASAMPSDLARLETACARLELVLPSDFLLFMQTAQMWGKFRSVNGGYFDIRKDPARCPISDGFLVPFISDQQYCHFYFLHIAPGRSNHEIVWADDLYLGALYATSEEFEREYTGVRSLRHISTRRRLRELHALSPAGSRKVV
ncbi:hypothetical protein [Variovorax sp. 22077]|uniref:hypothetical protein n=1 Tax=Variovorax sp. 22077 TaxID=3453867 RepID=UPI003F86CC58